MIDKNASLKQILDHAWDLLLQGSQDKEHPFRYPALATFDAKQIHQRTVVLRQTDTRQRKLICYSDFRTRKIQDLQQKQQANWLFYDHSSKEQLRVSSLATLVYQTEEARQVWDAIPPKGRADYIGPVAPGTPADQYISNLPADFVKEQNEENTAEGFKNFCIVSCEVYQVEYLQLMKGGHLRAAFWYEADQWKKQWLAP